MLGSSAASGNERMRSTSPWTSRSAFSGLVPRWSRMVMLPPFSAAIDWTWSMPAMPRTASSTLTQIPSSTSRGLAPGHTTCTRTTSRAIVGKVSRLRVLPASVPRTRRRTIKRLPTRGCETE